MTTETDADLGIEIDPLRATESILSRLPIGTGIRQKIERNLTLPVERKLFLDLLTSSAKINVMMAGALVAIKRKDDLALATSLDELLEVLQENANTVGRATARLMMADEEGRVGEIEVDDG